MPGIKSICYFLFLCAFATLSYANQPANFSQSYPSGYFEISNSGYLDQQTREFLEHINQKTTPTTANQKPLPRNLVNVKNVVIQGPEGPFGLRIYKPNKEGPLPALIYLHGGGWVYGTLDDYDSLCEELCDKAKCLVISVDYHLAPHYPFPKPVHDCYFAAKWVAEHIKELGGDANRIAIAGDSAGGNLTAAVTLMARENKTPKLCCQVLICPVTNYNFDTLSYHEFEDGYFLTKKHMKFFWESYLGNIENGTSPYASPLRAEHLSNLPPACIVVADFDPLRDEGLAYSLRLHKEGVPTTVKRFNTIHGFYNGKELNLSGKAISFVATHLREQFQKTPVSK